MRRAVAILAGLLLPPIGAASLAMSRFIGYLYVRSWPTRDLTFYDHRFDHLSGPRNWYWQERGVFGARVIPAGGTVLDLCCGEGTYAACYFASRAKHVDAIDRDHAAITLAARRFRLLNVDWIEADVLQEPFPLERYDVVTLFVAIEHFTVDAGSRLLNKIAATMKPSGTFVGSTVIFDEAGGHNIEHDNEFFSDHYLREFLQPHFQQIEMWSSMWNTRRDIYFSCRGALVLADVTLQRVINRLEDMRERELRQFDHK